MKNNTVKILIVAACFTLPVFGGTLMAHEHHRKKNTAVEIIDAVARLLTPHRTVVVQRPCPPVRYCAPAPVVHIHRHKPAPPPRHHHHKPAPPPKGHRGHRR